MEVWNSSPQWPWRYEQDIRKYLEVPDYWLVGYEEVSGYLRALQRGQLDCIGHSAGGRPISAVYYGPERPERKLCVAGGTHATETEGVAAVVNLISALETGRDLRGQQWPALQRAARRVGFYLVPFHNPDAAARSLVKSYVGMPFETVQRLHNGLWRNRQVVQARRIFGPWTETSDLTGRLDQIAYLGARFNDAGRLVNRPCSRKQTMCVETRQLLEFIKANKVDCYMDMHSASCPPEQSICPWLGICHPHQTSGDHRLLVKLQKLTGQLTKRAGGPDVEMGYKSEHRWSNTAFFSANLGTYGFTYEEHAGWEGMFPPDWTPEDIWLANTYNGMYTILGLAQALLQVPSPWK